MASISFRPRRGLSSEWAMKNPRLGEGEMGFEIDTQKYKLGDGVRRWNLLPYFTNEEQVKAYIDAEIAGLVLTIDGVTEEEFNNHVNSPTPHPAYDDGPSFVLLYENAKV